jgi:peroxisomal coenzyme A diphosphatase NUDT7
MADDRLNRLRASLPERPHILGKDEYVNCAVLVLLMKFGDELCFVLERREEGIRQGGELCFPGGRLHGGESPLAAALRETEEELGLPVARVEVIGQLDTLVAPTGMTIDAFVAMTTAAVSDLRHNPAEVAELCLVPISVFAPEKVEEYSVRLTVHPTAVDDKTGQEVVLFPAKELGLPARYHEAWGGHRHRVFVYRTSFGVVWGLTGRLIHDVAQRMR